MSKTNFSLYRVANGTAVSIDDKFSKDNVPYLLHWFKEPILSLHASHIVPKGSPLQVEWTNTMAFELYTIYYTVLDNVYFPKG